MKKLPRILLFFTMIFSTWSIAQDPTCDCVVLNPASMDPVTTNNTVNNFLYVDYDDPLVPTFITDTLFANVDSVECLSFCLRDCYILGTIDGISDGAPGSFLAQYDFSVTGPAGYSWEESDWPPLTTDFCFTLPAVAGYYDITFTDGTTTMATTIQVLPSQVPPIPITITPDPLHVCSCEEIEVQFPEVVDNYDQYFTLHWDLGSGNEYKANPCNADGTGIYPVSVNALTTCGQQLMSQQIFIVDPPAVTFKVNENCDEVTVTPIFQCLELSDMASFTWYWGDGPPSSVSYGASPIPFQYNNPGTYYIAMEAYDNDGNPYNFEVEVIIEAPLESVITGPINVEDPCDASTLYYEYTNYAQMTSSWLTVSGGVTASFHPSIAGTIVVNVIDPSVDSYVTLHYIDENGCENSVKLLIPSCCNLDFSLHGPIAACADNVSTYTVTGTGPVIINSVTITPAGMGTWAPGGTSNEIDVTWSSTGTATITVNYSYNEYCEDQVSIQVQVKENIPVSFTPPAVVCLNGGIIDLINYVTPSNSGTFSGTGVSGTQFNPATAGIGTWPITFTYTDPAGICSPVVVTQNIQVVDGLWNITTSGSLKNDGGNDIITDAEGNIYVTGTFSTQTTFQGSSDVTIPALALNSSTPEYGSAYIAKYDQCGELVWVNFDSYDVAPVYGYTHGSAITIDDAHDHVYIGGYIKGAVQFQNFGATVLNPVTTPGSIHTAPANGTYYIARFNTADGSFDKIHVFPQFGATAVEKNYELTGLDIVIEPTHSLSAQIYYSGYYATGMNYEGSNPQIFSMVGRIQSTSTGFSTTGSWRERTVNGQVSHATDVAISTTTGRVYITGDFKGSLFFNAASGIATTAVTDAYLAEFSAGTGTLLTLKKGGAASGETGKGTGVDVMSDGKIYFTGTMSNSVSPLFGIPGATFTGGTALKQRGYVLALNSSLATLWIKNIETVAGGHVIPTDVFVRKGATFGSITIGAGVYITGTFTQDITSPAVAAPANDYISTSGLKKSFVYKLKPTDGGTNWFNSTTDAVAGSEHLPARITSTLTYVYSTGTYAGEMGYNVTGPVPYYLTQTSTPALNYNTYIIRNEVSTGNFKSAEDEPLIIGDPGTSTENDVLKIYPNPTSGQFNVVLTEELIGKEVTITLTDVSGKMVQYRSLIATQTLEMDLSEFETGIYFIRISTNESEYNAKIIKE